MAIAPVPPGYTTVSPYLVVGDALSLFDFLVLAVGAIEIRRAGRPDGSIFNVEARIGDTVLIIVQAQADQETHPAAFYHYLDNVDDAYAKAVAAGGKSMMEPANQFYGDRNAGFQDPAGNTWWLATRTEDLSTEELAERIAAADFSRH